MANWEKEKTYCAKRAAGLREEMVEAVRTDDAGKFKEAYAKSLRYMSKKERGQMFKMFASHHSNQ